MARAFDIEQLAWARVHAGRHRFDLASSAISEPDLAAMGLPSTLHWPVGRSLESVRSFERAIGERYGAPGARVHMTTGASEANAIVVAALAGAEGEVLVERPGYQPMRRAPIVFGTRVRTFDRLGHAGIVASLEAEVSPRTWLVSIADLHNPSGAALSEREASALNDLAEHRGFWLHCDETFRDADDRPLGTWASLGSRWVTTSTLTKCYGLGGLRVGWIAAHEEAMSRCEAVHRGMSVEPSHVSAALALELVPWLDRLRERTHAILRENHAAWRELTLRRTDLSFGEIRGLTTWCTFPGHDQGDAFAAWALEHHDLAVHPGRFFDDPRGVRITLGGEPGAFRAAIDEFDRASAAFLAAAATGDR